MTQRVRQNVAGLCVAVALAIIGLVLAAGSGSDDMADLANLVLAAGAVVGLLCLVNLAGDMLRSPRD